MNYLRPRFLQSPCAVTFLVMVAVPATISAQAPGFKLNTVYQCPSGQSFKVLSCTGANDADVCDVQSYSGGQPHMRGKSTYQQVMILAPKCHVQTAEEAKGGAAPQADANGFKIGDTVQVNTLFGWANARILAVNGNNYRVVVENGTQVTKTYPEEVRRIGPPDARDNAAGVFQLHDRVQLTVDGRTEIGEIDTILGMEYQVKLSGNRTVWAPAQALRRVGPAEKPATPKAGQPPKAGLTSCAGKIEGRYAASGPFNAFTVTFRSGKALLSSMGANEELECWMGGGKIYLHKPGEPAGSDMPIDINNDGSLQTPFGEIKKKGN